MTFAGKMVIGDFVFDGKDKLEIISVEQASGKAVLSVKSYQRSSCCPRCYRRSKRVHSYYIRKLKDLPMFDHQVELQLYTRKFYCSNKICKQNIFTERYSEFIKSYQRMTFRLEHKLLKVAMLCGGNAGRRICDTLNISTSGSTLIRLINKAPSAATVTPNAVGIDDWAFRKGVNYGTVVVDLERRRIIDLLPDREASTVTKWLKAHPSVSVVSRDRYVNYASGVSSALPEAKQVADRWHLIKNLGDSVKDILQRQQGLLKQRAKEHYNQQSSSLPVESIARPIQPSLSIVRKQRLMDEAKVLQQQGLGIRAIARRLNLSRATVKRYLNMQVALPKNYPSRLAVFQFGDHIKNAIATRPNVLIKELYQEICSLGYRAKRTAAYAAINKYMPKKGRIVYPREEPLQYWRPAEVARLFYRQPQELRANDVELINYLRKESREVETTYNLFQKFRFMLVNKCNNQLQQWINDARGSGIKELQSFAKGLLIDLAAVKNAFTLPWSNGQVEGQINKLKTIKRQMYGRASFHLLRKRLLYSLC